MSTGAYYTLSKVMQSDGSQTNVGFLAQGIFSKLPSTRLLFLGIVLLFSTFGSAHAANPVLNSPTATAIGATQATLGATLTSWGTGNGPAERGICWSTSPTPRFAGVGTTCVAEGGITTGTYTQVVTGLPAGTLIYYAGYADGYNANVDADFYGYTADATFTTLSPPAEPTFSATCSYSGGTYSIAVTWNSVSGATNYPVRLSGPSHATGNSGGFTIGHAVASEDDIGFGTVGDAPTGTSITWTGITSAGTYSYWGHAWNAGGFSNTTGRTVSCFAPPTVTSPTATAMGQDRGTFGATVTANGGGTLTARGMCLTTTSGQAFMGGTGAVCTPEGGTAVSSFTQILTGGTANTTYYYAGYASNSTATGYSSQSSATTQSPPTIGSNAAGSITQTTASLGASILTNPSSISVTRGACWSTLPNPSLSCANFGVATTGTGAYMGVNATGLSCGTLYYYRGVLNYTDGGGVVRTVYATDSTFTTAACASAPSLSTATNGSIGIDRATLGATITSNGGAAITARGTCWGTSPSPRGNCTAEGGTAVSAFSHARTGLSAGTAYYFAAYATNSAGTTYLDSGPFTTQARPSTSSNTATSITGSNATLGSTLSNPGGVTLTGRGISYFRTSDGADANTVMNGSATTGAYTVSAPLAFCNTGYTYQSVVDYTDGAGNSYRDYGGGTTFTSGACSAPSVSSPVSSSIATTQATLGATITSDGGTAITARGTCWATTSTPRINCTAEGGTSVAAFTHSRTGLSPGTTYFYAGYATNSVGTTYSADGTFTTPTALTITSTADTYPGPLTLTTSGGSGAGAVSYVVNSAGTAGCSVSGATLSYTSAGTCTVTATKAASSPYASNSSSVTTITISKAAQATLTLSGQTVTYVSTGDNFATLSTSGGSGTGAVTYAVTSPGAGCSITGSTLTYTSAGSCGVTATKASDTNYNSKSSTEATFTISKATPTLSVTNSPVTYNGSGQTATVSGSVAGSASSILVGGSASQTNAGTYAVTANFTPTDTTNYNSLTAASAGNFTISKATQSALTLTSGSVTYPSTLTLTSSGGSGTGAVTYVVTSAGTASCSITGTTLSYSNAGSCTVTATKAADTNYNSISSSATTVTVFKGTQSALSITSTIGNYPGPLTLTTSGGSGTGAVSYVVNSAGTAGCSVSGASLSFTSAGTCTVTATKAADTNYNSVSSISTTITLNVAAPTVGSPTATSIGTSTVTLGANVTSNGGGTLSARGVCVANSSGQAFIGGAGVSCTAEGGISTGAYSLVYPNRTPGATYYYAGYASNAAGTSYTSEISFTMQNVPTIGSLTATSVGMNQATLGASLVASGVTVSARGICWGTSPSPSSCTSSGTTAGVYTQTASSLSAGTLYYYRGYVTYTDGAGNSGTIYTSDSTITTQSVPTISSPTAASVGIDRATVGATFATNPSAMTITARGSCWGTAPSPASCTTSGSTATGVYTQTAGSLAAGTLYYTRGYVAYTDGAGISNTIYTSDTTFTTQSAPTISTATVSAVGVNQVTTGANFSANPSALTITARGVCWGTSSSPTSCTSSGTATGVYTQTASSLTTNTLYFFRGYVSYTDGAGISNTSYTSDVSTTTKVIPTITSPTSTSIGSSTATLGANFATNASALTVTGRGICWALTSSPTSNCTSSGTATGVFTQSVSGFSPGTTYFYRGYVSYTDAAGISGTVYSADGTFTTLTSPSISLPVSSSIGTSTVTLGATVTANGGSVLTSRGTCWGTTPSPRGNCLAEGGTTVAAFTHSRTGLTASTTYYFAGFATNLYGTTYTSDGTFTTMAPPFLISPTSTAISTSSATLGATLASNGGASIISRGVCWGTSPNPTGNCTSSGTALGAYTIAVSNLPSSTVIYYRGFATNVWGTSYSPDGTFTTFGLPTITGQTASSLASTQVTLSANIISNNGAALTARGTCYDRVPSPTINCLAEGDTSIGTFSQIRTGLTPGTAYYYRAYATNAYGTAYSSDGTFVTPYLADPTSVSVQAGNGVATVSYVAPPDSWVKGIVVLMSTSSPVAATPVDGVSYNQGSTLGGSTIACIDTSIGPSFGDSCTISGLTNGTPYHFKVFAMDNVNKYSSGVVPTGSPATPTFSTIIGSGIDPASVTIAPGGPATFVDSFTLKTATSSEAISSLIINLTNASSTSLVEITNDNGTVVYGSSTNPTSASTTISLTTNTLTANSVLTQYKIRITPKSQANLPVGSLGQLYPVSATVYSWTGTYTRSGADNGSATVTIDNAPPAELLNPTLTGGDSKFTISYTLPSDSDMGPVVVLVSTSPITSVPTDGVGYFNGNVIGSALVGCVDNLSLSASLSSCLVNGLSNGSVYNVKVFTSDTRGNYSAGTSYTITPAIPAATEKVTSFRYRNDDGTESNATYRLPEGSSVTSGFVKGDKIRLRFAISNESATTTVRRYQLEYSSGACSVWNAVPRASDITSQPWKMDISTYVADGTPTTHTSSIATPGGKSFVPGVVRTFSNTTPPLTLLTGQFTEVEYLIRSTAYSAEGTIYCFRVSNAGEVGNFMSQTIPTLLPISNIFRYQGGGGGGAKTIIIDSDGSGPVRTGGSASSTQATSTETQPGGGTTSTSTPKKGSSGDSDVGLLMTGSRFALNPSKGLVLGESTSQMCTNFQKTLSRGMEDTTSENKVSELQYFLKRLGYYNFRITGHFGEITESALKEFQKDTNIPSTGIAGPITRQKMSEMGCTGE
jgi:hypothetical protein